MKITVEVTVEFSWSEKLPYVLTVEDTFFGYIDGEGGEIYFDEHDGTRFDSLFPAIEHLFPKGAKAESNGKTQAWVSHWNDEALKAFDGKAFKIRYSQEESEDEFIAFTETAKLVA